MQKDTTQCGQVGISTCRTLAKQHRLSNASGVEATPAETPILTSTTDALDHCAGRLSYVYDLAEQLRPLLEAIGRLADTDQTIAGLASIGSETLDLLMSDVLHARDDLNEQVRLAQRREFCDFVERSAS